LPLKPYFNRIKKAYVIGTDVSDLIKDLSSIDFVIAGSISEAVRLASLDAEKNDVVLLAPACASFDQYENFDVVMILSTMLCLLIVFRFEQA